MTTQGVDAGKLKALAALRAEELGESEEDVKIRFVVPLLEALGHSRMRFEHKGQDVVLKEGLPRGCAVVVEVKRPEASLDLHLPQLERYALAERSLVAVLTNGRVVRIYAPLWGVPRSFADALLWEFPRAALAESRVAEAAASVLSLAALASKSAVAAVRDRQVRMEFFWEEAEDLRRRHREWREQLERRMRDNEARMAQLDAEQRAIEKELGEIEGRAKDKVRLLFRLAGVPVAAGGEWGRALGEPARRGVSEGTEGGRGSVRSSVPTRERRDESGNGTRERRDEAGKGTRERREEPAGGRGGEWTGEEVYGKATTYQRRIFATFVALGRRTLGLKEIAPYVRLGPVAIVAALKRFRVPRLTGGRTPLLELRRTSGAEHVERGNLCTIAPRCWPLLRRLYRDEKPQG